MLNLRGVVLAPVISRLSLPEHLIILDSQWQQMQPSASLLERVRQETNNFGLPRHDMSRLKLPKGGLSRVFKRQSQALLLRRRRRAGQGAESALHYLRKLSNFQSSLQASAFLLQSKSEVAKM